MIIVLCSLYFYGRILTCLCCCLDCCVNALPLCFCNVSSSFSVARFVFCTVSFWEPQFWLTVVWSICHLHCFVGGCGICNFTGSFNFRCESIYFMVLTLHFVFHSYLQAGLICRPIFTVLICWCGRCRRMLDNLDFGGLGIMQGCCVAGLDSVVHCKVISRSLVVTDLHICAAGFIVVNLLSWWVFDSDAGDVFYYGFNTSGKWLYLQGISCGLCIMFICGDAVLVVIVVFMFILQLPTWCGLGLVCWCLRFDCLSVFFTTLRKRVCYGVSFSVDWSFNYTGLLTIVYESVALLVIVQASMLTCMVLRMLFSEVSSGLLLVFGFLFVRNSILQGVSFSLFASFPVRLPLGFACFEVSLSDERCLGCGRTVSVSWLLNRLGLYRGLLVVACDVFLRMLGVSSGCLCDG
eukprot:gene3167-2149_t